MSKNIAIIPARGGSKRIPKKNIKKFLGKPIIFYSIDTARQSRIFSKLIVSTDDSEIEQLVSDTYPDVEIHHRSKQMADDYAPLDEAVREVLLSIDNTNLPTYLTCIYATAPFLSAELLHRSFTNLANSEAEALLPVVEFNYPIQRALKMHNGYIEMLEPKNIHVRSQDLDERYHDAGLFWMMKSRTLLDRNSFYTVPTLGIHVPSSQNQDIDTLEDWKIAELKYQQLKTRDN